MATIIDDLLRKDDFTKEELLVLLNANKDDRNKIYKKAAEIKEKYLGKKVYYRGLIEFSNVCGKDCLYCGIRKGNKNVERYSLTDEEILSAAHFSYVNKYGSIVLQSGELSSPEFVQRIERLITKIKEMSNNELGITLSLGEESEETYQRWYNAGAHRYLLRIESSTPELYYKIHPKDEKHSFETRLNCLKTIQKLGYQTGTGVMIGLPFQTLEHLADDLIFMREFDIDMCGMGPYIEHVDTPLYDYREGLMPLEDRFNLALKMIALLRIMMKDVNIASATALQAIDKIGREKGIKVGANIIMPNVTPGSYRDSYKLYDNKPCTDDAAEDCKTCLEARVHLTGEDIAYGEWGDSSHFLRRTKKWIR